MTIFLRPLTVEDLAVADTIAMAAYNSSSSFQPMLRRYLALQPDGWYLALLDGTPVGLGGAIDYGSFAYLGLMSVLPTMQKRGVGMALMEALLGWLDTRGCPTVLLNAREHAVSLYERCGFVEIDQTLQFRLAEEDPRPLSSMPGVASLHAAELPALAAFDAASFGASRLDVLASYFADDPRRFLVTKDGAGAFTGFLVAGNVPLGPWHASHVEVAEQLLQQALVLPPTGLRTATVSARHVDAQALFKRYGFVLQRTLVHMRRGHPVQRASQSRLYGLASMLLG